MRLFDPRCLPSSGAAGALADALAPAWPRSLRRSPRAHVMRIATLRRTIPRSRRTSSRCLRNVISLSARPPCTRSRGVDRAFDSVDVAITLRWARRRPDDFCNTYDARGTSSEHVALERRKGGERPASAFAQRTPPRGGTRERRAARGACLPKKQSVSRGPIGSSEGPELVAPNPLLAPIAHPIVARAPVDEWNLIDRDARARRSCRAISRVPSSFQVSGPASPREGWCVRTKTEVRAGRAHQERARGFPRARPDGFPVHAARVSSSKKTTRAFATRDACAFFSATRCPA